MPADSRSPVVVGVVVGCVAGVVAFLASSQSSATILSASPVSTSNRVAAIPTVAINQYSNVAAESELVSVPQAEDVAEPMQFELAAPIDQAKPWTAILAGLLAVPLAAAGFFLFGKRGTAEERKVLVSIDDLVTAGKHAMVASAVVGASASMVDAASAYPIFAQQAYTTPREATGRIVCANCHLASKPTEIEVPQAVLPDQVFQAVTKIPGLESQAFDASSVVGSVAFKEGQPVEFSQQSGVPVSQALVEFETPATANTVFKATIKVPYDESVKQVGAKGKPADLNVGAVLVLPEGFRLAPADRIPEKMKEEMNGLQFIQYSEKDPNILVVGPVPGKLYSEMTVALLSPDPATNRNVHYGTLPIYVGGNRGRGQLYPTGEKSNNNAYEAVHSGKIVDIELDAKRRVYKIAIEEQPSKLVVDEELPPGAELIVKKGDVVQAGQTITTNPNVGGFGQAESEIVLQDPGRVKAFLFFTFAVLGTQTMLVVKKKQYEQVQLSEMNF